MGLGPSIVKVGSVITDPVSSNQATVDNNAIHTKLADGVAGTPLTSVGAFHNTDFQILPSTGGALLTAGVAQLLDPVGLANRQRQTSADNIPHLGVASGTQQLISPISTTLNGATVAGATSATLTATKFTNRGAAAWVQAGSELMFEPGTTNQEIVVVLTVNYSTNVVTVQGLGTGGTNTGFKFAHATGVTVTTGALNQARDATIADGSLGLGLAAGATYLLNTTLNSGSGGWEGERSAAGELDGASGTGTAIAAEYEWNGNPLANGSVLSSNQFDRARNLNAKGLGSGTVSAALAANVTSLTLNAAPTTLIAGQKILLDRAGANPETNYVGTSYTAGSTTVPLQIATQFSHALNATVEWDQHAPLGPQLNGFLPDGIGIEEEALWDPVSQKFYIERAATQDTVSGQNVVMENAALINSAGTLDRMRAVQGDAQAITGVEASVDFLWNGTSLDRPRSATADAMATTGIAAEAAMVWNGASFDRAYNNIAFSPVASAARTANGSSGALQTNFNARGVTLFVNVTVVSGTSPTLLLAIQGLDPVSAGYGTLHAALANITATGLYIIQFYPGIVNSIAGYPATISGALPRNWQLAWTIGGTTPSFTFSVGAQFTI